MPRERFFNVGMTGNGLLLSSNRIEVNVVQRSTALQHTARCLELPDQLATLHRAISFIW